MAWKVERAVLQGGWKTRLIVDDQDFVPHPEALGFVVALEAAERSPNTVKTYLTALAGFFNWGEDQGVDWRTVNVLDLTRYKRHLQEEPSSTGRPRSTATVGLSLTAVAEFLRYCASDGQVDPSVATRLVEDRWVHPKQRRGAGENGQFRRTRINALRVNLVDQPPEVLSDEQVAAMRGLAATSRDRFLLRVLHDGGPRIGETLGLRTEDVHLLPQLPLTGLRRCRAALPHQPANRQPERCAREVAATTAPARG